MKRSRWTLGSLIGLVLGMILGPSSLASAPFAGEYYGDGRGLDCQQSVRIQWLRFPQQYSTIIDAFGYPDLRSAVVDQYRLCDGNWIGLVYDQNNRAIGYAR